MIWLYHGVVGEGAKRERCCIGQAIRVTAFERQVSWLTGHGQFVSMEEYLAAGKDRVREGRLMALTFDDGLKRTWEEAGPVLKRLGVPATFFITTAHLDGGPLLWFVYLNALCFETGHRVVRWNGAEYRLGSVDERKRARRVLGAQARSSGDPAGFCERLKGEHPLPAAALAEYGGMRRDQLAAMGREELFEVAAHTETHPYLGQHDAERQRREIAGSKHCLEACCGRRVRYFAYPAGDYNRATLDVVSGAGFDAAFATIPKGLGIEERWELERVGVYSPSLFKVCLKAMGVSSLARRVGIPVG